MDYSFDGKNNNSGERLEAMQDAVNNFIDQTATQNASIADPSKMHSIAIVTFASDSTVLAGFTDVNDSSAKTLENTVNSFSANGATAVDYGLKNASDLLTARAAANNGAYAEREKVVIVFTDGEPTHGLNYSAKVAHDAVNNALMIKSTGAKIYTIGIFNGANVNGTNPPNVFMNYTSSNYPKAYGSSRVYGYNRTYTINPGEEPYNTGYYMTADNADDLNNIFKNISSQIGKPNIELGSSATLVDVVSDYFTMEGLGTEKPTITAQTAAYNGNGSWAAPVTDNSITPVLTGTDTITIKGFDFDKNYISETARDGFYGKKLILKFVTLPDYDKIDEAGSFADAKIPTNDTTALLDSEGNPVDYVTSPKLTANTVTYQVIDSSRRTIAIYYRLPGATVTLLDKPADTAKYTYSDWTTQDATLGTNDTSFTMPDKDVTLTSDGKLKSYNVYYTYKGQVPTGASASVEIPYSVSVPVDATVTHPTVTVPTGYTFSGWVEDDGDIEAGVDNFTMPAENLHFYGTFSADYTTYTVEHYFMDTEGKYPTTASHSNVYDGVKTGDAVNATTPDYVGFTFDEGNENNVLTGIVRANGELVLKVYYKRNTHTVTYQYDGTVPEDADPTEDGLMQYPYVGTFYYGQTVTIQPNAAAAGYTFTGWRVYTGDTSITDDGTMIMPDKDVVLHGSFTAKGDTKYYIEHYFENLEDDNYTLNDALTSERTGQTGTTAYAEPLSGAAIAGFTYDAAETAKHNTAMTNDDNNGIPYDTIVGDGSLVLKLYYTRTRHTVKYEYTGTVPDGASAIPAALTDVKYGTTVPIANPATADGYTFDGWNIVGSDISVSDDKTTFTMPARDVVLTGHFNPIPSKYTVEHYLENADGTTYTKVEPITVYKDDVYANREVTGVPNTYNTYEYNVDVTSQNNPNLTVNENGVTGTVTDDGSLVLKLYYTRKAYGITYRFENNPGNVTLPTDSTKYKHGTVVDLADITAPAGYTFDGWYYGSDKVGDSLTMPAADVELVGRFTANSGVQYRVEYYLQKAPTDTYNPGTNPETDYDLVDSYTGTGTTGEYVVADTKQYPGFSFDTTKSAWNGHIKGDDSLILKLYYNRNTYTVSYYYFGTPPTDTTIFMGDTPLTITETNALINSENVLYSAPLTVKSGLTASNNNYEFRGWYTANLPGITSGSEIAAGTVYTMPAHNVEFRGALYDYTVYYDLDGGTLNSKDSVDPKQVDWDDADLLPDGTPEKENLIFSGWRHENKESYVTSEDKYCELAGDPNIEAIVLKAEYANGYTVTYDWGTENIPEDVTLPTDSKLYAEGDSYIVDTTYIEGYTVETKDELGNVTGVYTFSGWTDPNNGVMGSANVIISGSWTYEEVDTPVIPPIIHGGTVKLTKVDAEDNSTVLSGVVFNMYRASGTYVGTYTTDRNGEIQVSNLSAGTYYWQETRSAEGYVLDDSKYTFKVTAWQTIPCLQGRS